ncbi:MAG: leucine-rich repeat protein [Acutalibacteraceae bacterium]
MDKEKIIVSYFKLNEKERQERYLATNGLAFLKKGMLAVGYTHFVTLQDDGTAAAFGNNEYGQCNVDGWCNVIKVAAGDFHTVALKSDGTVSAAGDNRYGQCNVAEWRDIADIFADKGFTIGVTADGRIMATRKTDTAEAYTAADNHDTEKSNTVNDMPAPGVNDDFEYKITNGEICITKYNGNADTVVIPEEIDGIPVRSISDRVFYNNKNISSLVLSENLREIGEYAFGYCSNLSEIKILYGLETIGDSAFYNCDIKELILPESVKEIGDGAFRRNRHLNKLAIPDSVEAIGDYAFPHSAKWGTVISAETKKRLKNYDNIFF